MILYEDLWVHSASEAFYRTCAVDFRQVLLGRTDALARTHDLLFESHLASLRASQVPPGALGWWLRSMGPSETSVLLNPPRA